jgi:hypothetical protein
VRHKHQEASEGGGLGKKIENCLCPLEERLGELSRAKTEYEEQKKVKNHHQNSMVYAQSTKRSKANRATSTKCYTVSLFVCFDCLLQKYII